MKNYVKVEVEFKHATPDAVLIAQSGDEVWIPRVFLSWVCDNELNNLVRGDEFQLELDDRKADDLGLIY